MSLFRRLGRATLTLGAVGVGGAGATLAGMGLWTRKCSFEPFGPETDPLFKHALLKLTNPYNKPYTYDSCTRTLNYSAVQPALLEDARQGGTKLIEAFAAGMWGGYGTFAVSPPSSFAPQVAIYQSPTPIWGPIDAREISFSWSGSFDWVCASRRFMHVAKRLNLFSGY